MAELYSRAASAPGPQRVQCPLVSVVMPVYNAQAYLAIAIESILSQTFQDFELIAVDDGSTDESLQMLKEFARRDARVYVISRPNTGIVGALNDGLAAARGVFIARMDADDVALPNRFERQLAYLGANPACVAVGAAVLQIDPDGDPICIQYWAESHEEINRLLLSGGGGLAHPTAMIRAAAIEQAGGYRQEYQWIEDKDLWLRLGEAGLLANLREPLLEYCLHEKSVCWQREQEQRQLWAKLLAETFHRRGIARRRPVFSRRHQSTEVGLGRTRAKWVRAAAKSGNYKTAAKHARHLLQHQPLEAATWLALCRGALESALHRMAARKMQ
jgi:glycosyltransferase involved in cell wall biosynthesis